MHLKAAFGSKKGFERKFNLRLRFKIFHCGMNLLERVTFADGMNLLERVTFADNSLIYF